MGTEAIINKDKNNVEQPVHSDGQCDICHTKSNNLRALVSNGQFYQGVCDVCRGGSNLVPMDAAYQKARDREDYAKETLQPYDADGKPNKDFFIAYPHLQEDMLTPEERAEI